MKFKIVNLFLITQPFFICPLFLCFTKYLNKISPCLILVQSVATLLLASQNLNSKKTAETLRWDWGSDVTSPGYLHNKLLFKQLNHLFLKPVIQNLHFNYTFYPRFFVCFTLHCCKSCSLYLNHDELSCSCWFKFLLLNNSEMKRGLSLVDWNWWLDLIDSWMLTGQSLVTISRQRIIQVKFESSIIYQPIEFDLLSKRKLYFFLEELNLLTSPFHLLWSLTLLKLGIKINLFRNRKLPKKKKSTDIYSER